MTTDPIARLVYGTRILDLNDGIHYKLEPDFAPPAAILSAQMSDGTSANRTGGATKIGQRAMNRQWSFGVQCIGNSERDVRQAINNLSIFTDYAGVDKSTPLYFEFKPNSDINFKPSWGQDGWLRYEVRHANPPQIGPRYGSTNYRAQNVTVLLGLEIAPYAIGLQQRLCTSKGGILEDVIGSADGQSKGVIIPEATTNKFTNPVFGYSTWNNGWTAAANVVSSQNTNQNFLLPGTLNSAKLDYVGGGANTWTQSINVGNTNAHSLSFIAKRNDGGALTNSDIAVYYGSNKISTVSSLGNGWYLVKSENFSGVASATDAGVVVVNSGIGVVYVTGFLLEEKAYSTQIGFGDMLGWAWTGTAHNSTSTRTASLMRVNTSDTWQVGSGTIRIVWKAGKANTSFTGDGFIFQLTTLFAYLKWLQSNNTWLFYDGANTAASAAKSFAAGDTLIFHVVRSQTSGLILYLNGSSIATSATFTPAAVGTTLQIGSDVSTANHIGGTFMDFTAFDFALSSTQVQNDYANINAAISNGQRVGSIPWLWTKDGDDVVDNCDDSSRDNYIVVGGISGSDAPDVLYNFTSNNANTLIYLGGYASSSFLDPTNRVFYDMNTTGTSSGDSGSAVSSATITTSPAVISGATGPTYDDSLSGQAIVMLARMKDAGSNLLSQVYVEFTNVTITTDYKSLTSVNDYRIIEIGMLSMPFNEISGNPWNPIGINPRFKRSTGSNTVTIDYFIVLPNVSKITASSGYHYLYSDSRCFSYDSTSGKIIEREILIGKVLYIYPNKYNVIVTMLGFTSTTCAVTDTLTYNSIKVTPRSGLA